MAVIHTRRRRHAGLGDLQEDMHNAAQNAPTVTDFPAHAPYLMAIRYAGKTLINLNNPADNGGDDTANWVEYTGAFYGKTEEQKQYYWGGQGAPIAIPGWTPEMAVKDPAGYQQALAEWQRAHADDIARETADIRNAQRYEFEQGEKERAEINRRQAAQDKADAEASIRASGGTWDGRTSQPVVPQIPQTLTVPTGGGGGGAPVYTAPGFPSGTGNGGGSPTTGGPLSDANPQSSSSPVGPSGGGGPGFGPDGSAPSSGGGMSPLVLGAAAVLGYLLLKKGR